MRQATIAPDAEQNIFEASEPIYSEAETEKKSMNLAENARARLKR